MGRQTTADPHLRLPACRWLCAAARAGPSRPRFAIEMHLLPISNIHYAPLGFLLTYRPGCCFPIVSSVKKTYITFQPSWLARGTRRFIEEQIHCQEPLPRQKSISFGYQCNRIEAKLVDCNRQIACTVHGSTTLTTNGFFLSVQPETCMMDVV